ncbi:hypothetical protein [Clostridium kluyveri]|uniref:hypothetical protein n=1 Tax=Clostridium kluyveri TaxID=1534 RepID=UPI00224872CF|nr:hypothetical protein [Clostridium kluyveri]UZQ49416.1 hypothetical protein OP486_15860 [Clostridium kluyveri]
MKKQSKIVIAAILLILLSIGGYYKYGSNKAKQVSNNIAKDKAVKVNDKDKGADSSTTDNKNENSNSKGNSTSNTDLKSASKSAIKSTSASNGNNKDKVTLPEITAVNLGLSYAIEINYDTVKEKVAAVKFYSGNKEIKSKVVNLKDGKFMVDDEPTSLEVLDKDGKIIAIAKVKS